MSASTSVCAYCRVTWAPEPCCEDRRRPAPRLVRPDPQCAVCRGSGILGGAASRDYGSEAGWSDMRTVWCRCRRRS
jgi:hypothetical protein